MYKFVRVREENEKRVTIQLFREYNAFLGFDLSFQSFEQELIELSNMYGPPYGELFLIQDTISKHFVGCAGIRKLEPEICELKRMYVKPEARGKQLGQLLLDECLKVATELRYSIMRLDSLPHLKSAVNLYQRNGFYPIDAYCYNPFPEALYFEKIIH